MRGCDLWNDNNDADASARRVGHTPCTDTAAVMAGQVGGPLKLEGQSLDRG